MLAVPVLMGADQTLVGIIAGAWTADQYLADVRTDIAETWLTSLVILAVCLTVSAFLMRRWVSRPLGDVTQAMAHVSDGDLESVIPHVNKSDEVGRIARALDDQRQKLILAQEADALAREAGAKAEAAADLLARQQELQQAAVETISKGLEALAEGDLSCTINSPFGEEYELLRKNFNQTLQGLNKAM
ncbi:unnamed protein product, partial [Ectocarpus sp. 12 AP-2014]